jgi:hypothetical protein
MRATITATASLLFSWSSAEYERLVRLADADGAARWRTTGGESYPAPGEETTFIAEFPSPRAARCFGRAVEESSSKPDIVS